MQPKPTEYFSRAELRGLVQRPRFVFAAKAAAWAAWLVGSALCLRAPGGWFWLAVVSLGLAMAHGVELSHQALHNSGFRRRWANTLFGYLAGAPMLVSFGEYRERHLRHHRTVGTAEDSEFFDYGEGGLGVGELLLNLSMLRHYARYFARLQRSVLALVSGRARLAAGQWFYPISFVLFSTAGALLWSSGQGRLLAGMAAALLLVAGPLHYLVELPEHLGCDNTSPNVLANTRTIETNRLLVWFVNGNNYHVEHHLLGCAPLENAAQMHRRLAPHLQHSEAGYLAFYRKVLSGQYVRRRDFCAFPETEAVVDEG